MGLPMSTSVLATHASTSSGAGLGVRPPETSGTPPTRTSAGQTLGKAALQNPKNDQKRPTRAEPSNGLWRRFREVKGYFEQGSEDRDFADKPTVDQLLVPGLWLETGLWPTLVPQHTGCKQRSCSGKEEEEGQESKTDKEVEEEEEQREIREFKKKEFTKERGLKKKKGSSRMPGRPSTSLVCFALHLGLFSASFGAAVDAPKTVTETVSSVKGEEEGGGEVTEERAGGRFPRSVSDYQDSLDYPNKLTAYGAEDSGSRSRRRFSENQWKSEDDAGEWELAAQVAKRGQRGRGEYYRGPAEEEVRFIPYIS